MGTVHQTLHTTMLMVAMRFRDTNIGSGTIARNVGNNSVITFLAKVTQSTNCSFAFTL